MSVDDDGLDRPAGFEREQGLADIRGRDRILETLRLGLLDIVAAATAIELKVRAFGWRHDREPIALAFPYLADSASLVVHAACTTAA